MDQDKTQDLSRSVDPDKTQDLSGVRNAEDAQKTEQTTSFDAVSDKTQAIDLSELEGERPDGTREFPAVIADDAQAKDMTVMLAGKYAAVMGVENDGSHADPERDDSDTQAVLDGPALVPTGKTEVLPFTRKYFEQYETDGDIPEEALEPKTSESSPHTPAHSAPKKADKKKRTILIVIVIVVIAIAAAIIASVLWTRNIEHERALEPHAVVLQMSAPEYGANDSKFPVHVEGADIDGNLVDEIQYADADGRGIELIGGDYALTIAAAPLMQGARIYRVPDTRVRVVIDNKLKSGEEYTAQDARFEFEFAFLIDVTDDEIEASYDYALKSGFDEATAKEYRDALTSKRDAEIAAQRAEEERQQRMSDTQSALTSLAKSKGESGISSKLIDVNGDGFPELLLAGNADSAVGAMCFIYSYDAQSHRTVELASAPGGSNHSPSIWYSTSSHEIAFETQGASRDTYIFYAIEENRAIQTDTFTHEIAKQASSSAAVSSSSSIESNSASASDSGASTSSSASSVSSSTSSSSAPVPQDTFSHNGESISVEAYNDMIYNLNDNFYTVSAP